ncbi:alginate lyase family protein [Cyclobacterium jeungdonense]|uniref:Alginate lyase family protein n=1 Tax=Cyclobacterium jeungdonense TaxID=708087 RepID=A0ABT8C4P9_9BACT|nr:alginate lyase family protein [Cyclobacterium jeungdonense]MDN3686593.1 alginate lyase family protein [Cyclobacterium jeungdonense]
MSRFAFRICLSLIVFVFQVGNSAAQKNWKELVSVEDLYQAHPETVKGLFAHLDLNLPELAEVKEARDQGNWIVAADRLLDYYEASDNAESFRKPVPLPTDRSIAEADTILENVFTIQNVKGKVPILPDGHRDWYYKGPNNDREWAWLSNRHSQLMVVMNAYFETGNPKYVEYLDLFLRDFILKSMPYPGEKGSESIWRGLEVAARAKAWTKVFYAMLQNEYLSPATRLLILSSLPDHAHYSRNFHGGNNWLTMEISALATIAAYFPEFRESDAWLDYAIAAMTESMRDQVYPDGVQTELASHYHNVSLHNFELFQTICDEADRTLPLFFTQTIESMYRYIARAVRPDGHRILNNDGDRGSDRSLILEGAEKFNRPDWAYIASNGSEGSRPSDGPSYFFPWAGQLISRSGFDSLAHWSFFDIGPWGSGHQHNDKLHLSVAAFGKDFLVDAGRFAYTGAVAEKFRPYARSSRGHNVLLIDGKGQAAGPTHASTALNEKYVKISDAYDFASQSFDRFEELEGEATHIRSLFYLRGKFWVVADRIHSDRPREIQALWHWHPDVQVEVKEEQVIGKQKEGVLSLSLISPAVFDAFLIKGQEVPEIQGWYSPEYNLYEPNVATLFEGSLEPDQSLVWLIVPAESDLEGAFQAKILSENDSQIEMEVQVGDETWHLVIPFLDSSKVKLTKTR